MADAAVREPSPKRPVDAPDDGHKAKRPRRPYHHQHRFLPLDQPIESREPAFVDPETAEKLLFNAIKTIIEEEGLKREIYDPVIEALALTAFHDAIQEYILKFCSKVRRSMTAARRNAPIATDFESAIYALDVPRLDDQLKAYRTQPEINPRLLPTPPPDDPFHNHVDMPAALLGPDLGGQTALTKFHPNPSFLPPLPSAHTYKDTAVFAIRETDSRRIRELATEEGKLGEQALRRLAGAVKLDATHPVDPDTHRQAVSSQVGKRQKKTQPKATEAELFEDTMRDLLKAESDGFELGPIVTSEKSYRMPDEGLAQKRLRADDKSNTAETATDKAKGKEKAYDTLPPPLTTSKARDRYADVDVMEL
ncbi:uncharacterized protein HMPREF1541_09250 [Cyphellophora europaea CBS 101466]|uniref:Transcription initiation factor TFIID subunit 8 n=1 Tax=Cyphellophora europaea (strain CBS 101466) TaxID=1220924 RepID=W2SBY4_CYPE1|nr:uncharacterized protein HMPREF1541_09250 [Cyphellophora europaea CBS 101466]ETN45419.1 hypothetical protein HMPREF1541_09250 [Cyphellophora europaea CBS 101466]